MIRDQIREDIIKSISNFEFRILKEEVEVNRPNDSKNGDFMTNVSLKISHGVKQSPMEIANILADSLKDLPYIKKLQAANPGFVNFYLKDSIWQDQVKEVLDLQGRFGSNDLGKGKKARVEFVSANPTGPLHFGNARGGPSGDVLASVLEFSGYEVLREYYNNDVGGQIVKLGDSILKVAAGGSVEDQEYKGQYIKELAHKLNSLINSKRNPNTRVTSVSLDLNEFIGREAVGLLSKENVEDCEAMGISFDKVYNESDFINQKKTDEAIKYLDDKKVLKEKDGAMWFAPNDEFLKDRETVVVKSDGSYTYFANDIAYHRLKFSEGYDLVVDVMGANHHGHVPRLNAAISALGFDVSGFKVILYQWVRFRKHGKPFSMSKRAGNFITAREVLDEIGSDALRFMLLMYDTNSPIDFDIDLAKEKSAKNPVYYVQYAYARICSILEKSTIDYRQSTIDYRLLSTNYERDLIKQISRLPELVEDISRNFEVHHLTKYAMDLADSFHKFYENCRVLLSEASSTSEALAKEVAKDGDGVSKDLSAARLALVEATKITLANTLKLLGVSAPEKM